MNNSRRSILKGAGAAGVVGVAMAAGLLTPGMAFANWNKAGFEAKSVDAALSAMGMGGAANSGDITVKAPDIAENGAVVPVEITTTLPNPESITILGEKNALPLVASFGLMNGAQGFISTRIKMGTTSNVRAVVRSGGRLFTAAKEVKVTIGGCGG